MSQARKSSPLTMVPMIWGLATCALPLIGYAKGAPVSGGVFFILFGVYGALLFSSGNRSSDNHYPLRIAPWVILVVGLISVWTVPTYKLKPEAYPPCRPVQDWTKKDVHVAGPVLGMTAAQILEMSGPPTTKRFNHCGVTEELGLPSTLQLARLMIRLDNEPGSNITFSNRADFQRAHSLMDKLYSKQPRLNSQGSFARNDTELINGIRNVVSHGRPFIIHVTELTLDPQNTDPIMDGVCAEREVEDQLLVLSLQVEMGTAGWLVRDKVRDCWVYDKSGTEVFFLSRAESSRVFAISAQQILLGNKVWAKVGDPVGVLNLPGTKSQKLQSNSRRTLDQSHFEFQKNWNGRFIRFNQKDGRITKLQIAEH